VETSQVCKDPSLHTSTQHEKRCVGKKSSPTCWFGDRLRRAEERLFHTWLANLAGDLPWVHAVQLMKTAREDDRGHFRPVVTGAMPWIRIFMPGLWSCERSSATPEAGGVCAWKTNEKCFLRARQRIVFKAATRCAVCSNRVQILPYRRQEFRRGGSGTPLHLLYRRLPLLLPLSSLLTLPSPKRPPRIHLKGALNLQYLLWY